MGQAKQARRMAVSLGLAPLFGVRLADRPRAGQQIRRIGERGVTLCGDLLGRRRARIEGGTHGSARRLCGTCSGRAAHGYDADARFGCGEVLERQAEEIVDVYDDKSADDIVCEFGARIDEIRAARNAALGLS